LPFSVNNTWSSDEIAESLISFQLKNTTLLQFNSAISRIKFSPNFPFSTIALPGLSGPWIESQTREHRFSFAESKSPLSAVGFRRDSVLIAVGRERPAVDTYPTRDHEMLHRRWKWRSGIVFTFAFSPFPNELIAGCLNETLTIIAIASRTNAASFDAHLILSHAFTRSSPGISGRAVRWMRPLEYGVLRTITDLIGRSCSVSWR
jgi:hypothetical protein